MKNIKELTVVELKKVFENNEYIRMLTGEKIRHNIMRRYEDTVKRIDPNLRINWGWENLMDASFEPDVFLDGYVDTDYREVLIEEITKAGCILCNDLFPSNKILTDCNRKLIRNRDIYRSYMNLTDIMSTSAIEGLLWHIDDTAIIKELLDYSLACLSEIFNISAIEEEKCKDVERFFIDHFLDTKHYCNNEEYKSFLGSEIALDRFCVDESYNVYVDVVRKKVVETEYHTLEKLENVI